MNRTTKTFAVVQDDEDAVAAAHLSSDVHGLELRHDRSGADERLRKGFKGVRLFAHAHTACDDGEDRTTRLRWALETHDLVALDMAFDVTPERLQLIPQHRRVIVDKVHDGDPNLLIEHARRLLSIPAMQHRLVTHVTQPGGEGTVLQALVRYPTASLSAYDDGPFGFWTVVAGAHMGASAAFARAAANDDGPGAASLARDYGLARPRDVRVAYGIAGDPVHRALSPRLHNLAYERLGIPAVYLPFRTRQLSQLWPMLQSNFRSLTKWPLRGLTVVSPCKEQALQLAGTSTLHASEAGAANLVIEKEGDVVADTTDTLGALAVLREARFSPKGKRVAVIGCGGAGRAVATGLRRCGANVFLINRSEERGKAVAERLRLPFLPLLDFSPRSFKLVVNCTPCGSVGDDMPFAPRSLAKGTRVIDFAYRERAMTPLLRGAQSMGCAVIDGRRVLAAQVGAQFEAMTGVNLDRNWLLHQLGMTGVERDQSDDVRIYADTLGDHGGANELFTAD